MPNLKEVLYTGAIALLAVAIASRVSFLGNLAFNVKPAASSGK